jgi:predicted phage terminase large subunit-like protein
VTPDRDKVTRAQPLALRYEQGLVFHEQLPSWFEDELLAFPQGVHDDAVDAAVYAYQAVMSMRGRDSGVGQVEVFDPFDPEMGT